MVKKFTLVSVSFGHEIAVTPLQFITAFAAFPMVVFAKAKNYEINNESRW